MVIVVEQSLGTSLDVLSALILYSVLFCVLSSVLIYKSDQAFKITSSSENSNCRKNKSRIRGELCVQSLFLIEEACVCAYKFFKLPQSIYLDRSDIYSLFTINSIVVIYFLQVKHGLPNLQELVKHVTSSKEDIEASKTM